MQIPKLIGHRGAAAYAPENTLEGIHTAADMGIKWVELDVKLTADNVPILFHDETLGRTSNGAGPVAEKTLEQIRELECGHWFSESFAGIRIPTLEEAIDVLLKRDLGVNFEIKPCPGREQETAEIALDVISQIWDEHEKILISSFQPVSLETAYDMAGDWPRGLLLPEQWPENWRDMAEFFDVKTVNVNGNKVTREQVESIIDAGYGVLAYTINDVHTARKLFSWGVDGVFSDAPDVIANEVLKLH